MGIDVLLGTPSLQKDLQGRKIAFLGHAASVTGDGRYSLDALMDCKEIRIVSVFAPQHGFFGEKQDNMIESEDFVHPRYGIPVFSLYGRVRRPTAAMLDTFDVLLVDLQDIGARPYTYLTTLFYMMEACAAAGKSVWVPDRPDPAGRPVEGSLLRPGWESFIGPAPLIMRHGMTPGELALWYREAKGLDLDLRVIRMEGYDLEAAPGYGWPVFEHAWVPPSPNASSLNMARCYPGTVLFEGTTLSEGRGTATPLERVGAPDIDFIRILERMQRLEPAWLEGCTLLPVIFEPVFDKHRGQRCSGIHIFTDDRHYRHEQFRPHRLAALVLKSIRLEYPDYRLWRDPPFEYEYERLPIDLLSGGTFLRKWVDDAEAGPGDLDHYLRKDETRWEEMRRPFLLY